MTHDSSIARALHVADQALGLLRRGELDRARAMRQTPAHLICRRCSHVEAAHRGMQQCCVVGCACVAFVGPPLDLPVLFVSNDFTTLAGSQIYATRWMEDLARRGLMVGTCDVLQLCARDRAEVAKNVAALVTWGDASQTIMRRFFGFSPSPPLVALTGNVADSRTDPGWLADLVVCSTEHAMRSALEPGPSRNGGAVVRKGDLVTVVEAHADRAMSAMQLRAVVLHPPIAPVYFETPIPPLSERRAVVQVNLSKRPEVFDALARAMPDVPFIAVRGYGEQRIPQLPNVTVLPRAAESPMLAYQQARVLIQPGIESYGLAAAEAAAMGAFVIANGEGHGARETMAPFLIDSADPAEWLPYVAEAAKMPSRSAHHETAEQETRDALLARQRAELDAAADALARLMGR